MDALEILVKHYHFTAEGRVTEEIDSPFLWISATSRYQVATNAVPKHMLQTHPLKHWSTGSFTIR